MPQTVIRGTQILNNTVQRQDLDTSTVGQAVVTKLVQGSGISLSSTGADSGTGDVTVSAAVPIADNTQSGLLRQTSGNTTDFIDGTNNSQPLQPVIWSVRLRSFNAVGNPNMEITQRNAGTILTNPANGVFIEDRWTASNAGSLGFTVSHTSAGTGAGQGTLVPGTNFNLSNSVLQLTLSTQKITLAATDAVGFQQLVEGPCFRELSSDVHSVSLLVQSSVAGLKFGLALRDPSTTRSLTKLCTLGAAGTNTLIKLPNLPIWPSAGNFSTSTGVGGYYLTVTLTAGSTYVCPANDTWQNGGFIGAVGQDNFFANAVNSYFQLAFVQHEPGAACSGLMDLDFDTNLSRCQRYFQKSYLYGTKPQTASIGAGLRSAIVPVGVTSNPVGPLNFLRTMAKTPTINIYAYDGSANNVTLIGGGNLAMSSVMQPSDSGFQGITLSATATAGQAVQFHYTADTGW